MITASDAKKEFGRVLETAMLGPGVVITKHDTPKAVLLSIAEFNRLSRSREIDLDALRKRFDAAVDRMQTPKARAAMQAAFDASPAELGRAAVAAARRRK